MIIDTSVIISAVERRDEIAIAAIESMEALSVRSMIVVGELTFGRQASTSSNRAIRQRTLDLYLAISDPSGIGSLDCASLAQLYGSISAVAKSQKVKIGQNDRWIVAESLVHQVPVWTSDLGMESLLHAVAKHYDISDPVVLVEGRDS